MEKRIHADERPSDTDSSPTRSAPRANARNRARVALASLGLGACAVACLAPLALAALGGALGAGIGSSLVCSVPEAVGLGAVGLVAAVVATRVARRRGDGGGDVPIAAIAPIACDLAVFTPGERAEHLALGRRLFSSIESLDEEEQGFAFSFAATEETAAGVAHWVANERRCCPFFRFETREIAPAKLLLRITGPEGAKAILRAALDDVSPPLAAASSAQAGSGCGC